MSKKIGDLTYSIYALVGVVTLFGVIGLIILAVGLAALWTINGNMGTCCSETTGTAFAPVMFQWTTADFPISNPKFRSFLKPDTKVNVKASSPAAGNVVSGLYQVTGGFVTIKFNQLVIEGCSNWTVTSILFIPSSQMPANIRPPSTYLPGANGDYKIYTEVGSTYSVVYPVGGDINGLLLIGTCDTNVFSTYTLTAVYTTL